MSFLAIFSMPRSFLLSVKFEGCCLSHLKFEGLVSYKLISYENACTAIKRMIDYSHISIVIKRYNNFSIGPYSKSSICQSPALLFVKSHKQSVNQQYCCLYTRGQKSAIHTYRRYTHIRRYVWARNKESFWLISPIFTEIFTSNDTFPWSMILSHSYSSNR